MREDKIFELVEGNLSFTQSVTMSGLINNLILSAINEETHTQKDKSYSKRQSERLIIDY